MVNKIIAVAICFLGIADAQEVKFQLGDTEIELLLGKNLAIVTCEPSSQILDDSFGSFAYQGMIPFGDQSGFLIKNNVAIRDIIYISPSIRFDLGGGRLIASRGVPITEFWTEVRQVGGDLELYFPLQKNVEVILVAESVKIGDRHVLVVRSVKPTSFKSALLKVIEPRRRIDEELIAGYQRGIKEEVGRNQKK